MPARVQVGGGAAHRDVDGEHAARGDVQRRLLGRPHRPVGRHGHVGPKHLAVGGKCGLEVGASDLLLALEQDANVHRQAAALLQETLDRAERREHGALVVARPAAVHPLAADRRLERRRLPRALLARRLHVVVGVDEHRRRALGAEPLPEHERVPACRDDTAAERAKPRREPRRRAPDVVAPGGVAAHAGDRNQLLEGRDGHRHALTRSSRTSSTPACQTASQSACGRS